ncbi:glycoside hydrolase family 5 protein [Colwellia piezophila]|uniref:glycoside hydrolase family 5 protein n=1 Tax=Colwellia piezophila TaxID=211668 RepID=UPI0003777B00|nr:cellulase family glycosylhydrolase [Colwellia piezophila]
MKITSIKKQFSLLTFSLLVTVASLCSMLFSVSSLASTHAADSVTASQQPASLKISTHKGQFIDQYHRTIIYRGINLSGSSKLPYTTDCKNKTSFCKNVSFVGRPFPLDKADRHFERLQSWGFNFIRLIVTWEALEHAGPKQYDNDYISYIRLIIMKAKTYGFTVLIDSHQDVWSRFTGGDGAPLWTLEKVGFNIDNFKATNAALTYNDPNEKIPTMIWPTNYTKLGAATMFSLFFAGNDFAPKTKIDGIPAQDFLQQHYIGAFVHLAKAIKDLDNVVGFDVMNEPHPGYIGQADLTTYTRFPLKNLATPTPAQSLALGAGYSVEVANWKVGLLGLEQDGTTIVNKDNLSAWTEPAKDVWLENGLWQKEGGKFTLPNEHYFSQINDRKVNFTQDYYVPFLLDFTQAIRAVMPETLMFYENPFTSEMPKIDHLENVVNATHWYDQITLIKKRYLSWVTLNLSTGKPVFGEKDIDSYLSGKLERVIKHAHFLGDDAPTLVGELGIPFDLSNGAAFEKNSQGQWDFSEQNLALDRSLRTMERASANYSLWNYTPDNSNKRGDIWNGEDLSIFSPDQVDPTIKNDINNGGRALRAAVRPFASAINGHIEKTSFDMQTGQYKLQFSSTPLHKNNVPTVIHLPALYYQAGFDSELSDGELTATDDPSIWHYFKSNEQSLHELMIVPTVEMARVSEGIWWKTILVSILFISLLVIFFSRKKLANK